VATHDRNNGIILLPDDATKKAESAADEPLRTILLFYTALPTLDQQQLTRHVESFGPLETPLTVTILDTPEGAQFVATIQFDQHAFRLLGFNIPAPDKYLGHSIDCSLWPATDKAPLQAHRTHIHCFYMGQAIYDATAQLIAMSKLASAFAKMGLVGWVDPVAWNCMPTRVLLGMLKPEMLESYQTSVPLGLWTGFAKLFRSEKEVWFVTKGYHRWDIYDFAFLGSPEQFTEVFTIFAELFYYLYSNPKVDINAGNTMSIGTDMLLKFSAVTEYESYLEGPQGTFVVEKVSRAEIH
jgi:hypothetical protein